MGGGRQGQRAKREGTTPGSRGNVMLGFSDVVNQEHQRVRAFEEEPGRKWEKLYDQLFRYACALHPSSTETLNSGTSWP